MDVSTAPRSLQKCWLRYGVPVYVRHVCIRRELRKPTNKSIPDFRLTWDRLSVLTSSVSECRICNDGRKEEMTRLKESNQMQQYADIYLLQNYSTCFVDPSHPSSGVHKTVVAVSGTDHTVWTASFFKRDQTRTGLGRSQTSPYLVAFEEARSPDSMICTTGCNYSFIYS